MKEFFLSPNLKDRCSSPWLITLILFSIFIIIPNLLGAYDEVWLRCLPQEISTLEVLCAMLGALVLLSLEVRFVCFLHRVTRQLNNKLFRASASFALLALFSAFQVVSWSGLYLYGNFPSLGNAAFLFLTESYIFTLHMTKADLQDGCWAILVTVGLTAGLMFSLKRIRKAGSRSIFDRVWKELLIALFIVMTVWFSDVKGKDISLVLATVVSPEVALAREVFSNFDSQEIGNQKFQPLTQLDNWLQVSSARGGQHPDVFIVSIEALRADVLQSQGQSERILPNLFKLAQKSTLFSLAYAVAPETGYALKAILSGRYPYEGDSRQKNYIADVEREKLLFDLLHPLGYKTGFFSATDWRATARLMQRSSVETYVDAFQTQEITGDTWVTREEFGGAGVQRVGFSVAPQGFADLDESTTKSFGDWVGSTPVDKPLFGMVYLVSSHFPWVVRDSVHRLFPTSHESIGNLLSVVTSDYQGDPEELKRHYRNAIHQVDHFFGRILRTIEERQQHRPVVLIVVGDHGEALGQHGHVAHVTSLFEEQVRILLLMYDSQNQAKNIIKSPVSQVDIAPTILELLGLPPYNGHQTESARSFAEVAGRSIYLTLQNYKSIDGVVEYPLKAILDAKTERLLVFNLDKDPTESNDISRDIPEVSQNLLGRIHTYKKLQKSYYGLPRGLREQFAPPRCQ